MNKIYSHDKTPKDPSHVSEQSMIIDQILGYSPPDTTQAKADTPTYPRLSEFDPPLTDDQIAIFRKIASVLASTALQAAGPTQGAGIVFSEQRGLLGDDDAQNRNL